MRGFRFRKNKIVALVSECLLTSNFRSALSLVYIINHLLLFDKIANRRKEMICRYQNIRQTIVIKLQEILPLPLIKSALLTIYIT